MTKGHRKIAHNEMMKNIAQIPEFKDFDDNDNVFTSVFGNIAHKIDKFLKIIANQDGVDLNEMERRFKK